MKIITSNEPVIIKNVTGESATLRFISPKDVDVISLFIDRQDMYFMYDLEMENSSDISIEVYEKHDQDFLGHISIKFVDGGEYSTPRIECDDCLSENKVAVVVDPQYHTTIRNELVSFFDEIVDQNN